MATTTRATELSFIAGDGEMARRLRTFDWQSHPLGPPEQWPQSLRIVIQIMLTSRYAMWLGWGKEFYFFCNDAYLPTVGLKRNWVLGTSARKVWAEIWPDIGPRAESVIRTGEATWDEGLLLFLERSGFAEETYHTFSYSPVANDDGSIGGMLCVVTEETERVIGARRLATLRDLAAGLDDTRTEADLFAAVRLHLSRHAQDIPFGFIYLFSDKLAAAELVCAHPANTAGAIAPQTIQLEQSDSIWPAKDMLTNPTPRVIRDLRGRFEAIPRGPWKDSPDLAMVVPLTQQGQDQPAGFFVAGLNPYRPLDSAYESFIDLLGDQIAAALSNVRAYEQERRRAEALAELDRAKTAFFNNISHEFRTPLTLMLGPLEEELRDRSESRQNLELAYRSTVRLLKLVNTLLDFSRIEAGRTEASFEPTNLAAYTAELASVFRSALEKAGLRLVIDCPELVEPVYVDQSMWEKIVLNLLSNAFKFTFAGEIRVSLCQQPGSVELAVSDTGTGIPAAELPKIFDRFHRVRGARSRSFEGTGIGLALVQELVKLHGGQISVRSVEHQGTTFTVRFPTGKNHLPAERVSGAASAASNRNAAAFVQEALSWLSDRNADKDSSNRELVLPDGSSASAGQSRPRILLADDNADMRDYVHRLLNSSYEVEAVANGAAALKSIEQRPPDLIITDVMMPQLDGFGLLERVRQDERTRGIPFLMLSARAGEEARVEGLSAGADEYLTKPFSARELLARVSSQIKLTALRRQALEKERELRQLIQRHAEELDKTVARRTAKLRETVAELEQFSYAITHDMRAPLRAMQGFAAMIEEEAPGNDDPSISRYARRIRVSATRLDQLITDSLNYSKILRQEVVIEPVDLNELIPGLVETYPNLQPDQANIQIQSNLPVVLGNDAALTQCFSNLLGNAAKFRNPGTTPHITVRAETIDPSQRPDGKLFARIWVEDDGIGVPEQARERIFLMFQRAAKGYEGTGIGLAIVRKSVERLGGKVGLASTNGPGSRFWVELPLADQLPHPTPARR